MELDDVTSNLIYRLRQHRADVDRLKKQLVKPAKCEVARLKEALRFHQAECRNISSVLLERLETSRDAT